MTIEISAEEVVNRVDWVRGQLHNTDDWDAEHIYGDPEQPTFWAYICGAEIIQKEGR